MRITFDIIKKRVRKSHKCACGLFVYRSTTFEQTVNPFNKNSMGIPKTRAEIYAELQHEADCWNPDFTCARCQAEKKR